MSSITTTINHGITLGTPGYYSPLTVTNTGAVNNNGTSAAIYGYAGTLQNAGTVSATGPSLDGVVFGGQFGTASIGNNGLVTATHSALYLAGYGTVTNTGTISSSGYDAIDIGSSGTVTNSTGTIIAAHWGIRTRGAGSVGNGGTIQASEAGIVVLGGGSVTNTGLISAPNGIEISGGAGSVVNAGSVNSNGANGVTLDAGGTVTNQANAVITSVGYTGVYIGGGAGELVNAGTINGALGVEFGATAGYTLIDSGTIVGAAGTAVSFGIGNDLLQFQPSTSVFIQGTVDGAGGTNTLEFTSGATTGTLTGDNASFTNFAIGTVDAGASWALAGNVTFGIGITLADNSALILAASGTLVNAGSITSELTGYSILGGGTAALLDNLGGIQAYNIGVSLRSGGTIINGASGNTTALISANYGAYAASGLISNYGTISASGTGSESVLLGGAGQVSNNVGGLITGHNIGVDLSGGVATLTNFGVVSAANNGALALYNGDVLMNGPGALIAGTRAVVMAAAVTTPVSDTLKNYGTITGQYGVIAGVIPTTGTLHTTIVDAGTIIGTGGTAISALATSASASVDLTLRLLVGNDFIQGAVVGESNSTGVLDFVSGSGAGTLTGSGADFINFQTASVDTGANWTFAGTNTLGANTTLVDAGMLTNAGLLVVDPPITVTGTFVNAGTLSLTAGSYVVQLAPGGYFLNTTAGVVARPNGGGTYAPAIYGETGGTSRVVNLGTISSDRFNVGIRLNAGGTVTNGATNATSALIYGGFPVLILGASGTVNNYGTLRAVPTFGGVGVSLGAGGVVNNGIAGSTAALIAGDDYGVKLGGGGTVSNFGTITAPGTAGIGLLAGGLISNQSGGTISGSTEAITAAGTATIDNFGIIQSTSVFAAIAMASGTVINGSASNTTAAILGSTYGIEATGVATVVNYGTVTANHQEGIGLRAGGSLDNLGVIDANEYGVFLYGPGTATNSGTITGLGGIVTNYDADVVVNSGDIAGTRGGGIILQAGGTVIDSGTISGSYFAVLFRGTVSNLLVLENGYKLSGPVGGSVSASSNVVELLGTSAANAVTANYNGLGLVRFGTIAFAPGAGNYADLKITNDATLPGTITNFTGVHDTIDLTTLAFVSGSSTATFNTASDQLTVSNGTNSVTLQLGSGSYSAGFTAVSDGATGTDIIVGPAALTYSWIGPSADWRTATNWSSGVIPGISASATIADAGDNTVTISSAESIQVANLTLSNADTLLVDGTFAPTGSIGVTGALLSIASGGTVSTFATLTVASTGTLIDSGALLDSGTLTNAGTIIGTGTGLSTHAVSLISGATLVNLAGGTVTSGAGSAVYWYTNLSTAASTVTNFGTISGNGGDGVLFNNSSGGVVTNRASAGANATISGSHDGVFVDGDPTPGVVTNTGGTNATALITGGTVGVYLFSSGTVTNSDGTITGGTTGVDLGDGPGITLVNTGDATGAALITGGSDGVFAETGSISIANTGGTIIGTSDYGVLLSGSGTITNTGGTSAGALIQGGKSGVFLGDPTGDFLINTNGTIIGTSRYGVDAFESGSVTNTGTGALISGSVAGVFMGAGSIETVANYATIIGGIGVELFQAGTVIDAGTIIGTGGTAITLGGEGVTLKFVPGNAFIQGLVTSFEYHTNRLEFTSGAAVGTLTGSGANFQNFPLGTVDAGANWVLAGGITFASSITLANSGTLTDSGTLINGGTITGLALDVPQLELAPGGYLLNQATGVITQNNGFGVYGQASGASTVTNHGTIAGYGGIGIGVYLKDGGSVTNTSAGALLKGSIDGVSMIDAAGTVFNSGSIVGLGSLGNGVILLSGGTVSNAAGGMISGGDGIRMGAAGTVLNQGSIAGGTIDGGVVLMASGSVSNAATGVISGAAYGVGALGIATVTNAGMIRATGTTGIGVTLLSGGTVIDSGTIAGATTAVALGGTSNNLLVLEHGYALTGGVVGSASASDTVELLGTSAANAVTVTYNTLGLTNVGTIAFAPGATNYATLRITNDATLPHTIAGFIGVHDTIDLTALSDAGNDATTSFNTLTNVLTVTGDDGSVMLQLDNEDYADVTWLAHNDGSDGTDVIPEAGGSASFTGTLANIGVPNEATSTPFSALTVTDPTESATDTVTITLSNPAFGTLSNLDGGGYDAATGVYTVSGTPAAVTTAIDQLVLTPASPAPNVYVTSTTLTVEAQGPVGGPATTSAIAASVQQILGLATVPSGQIAISVSADGTGFASAVDGDTNEAVVTDPTTGGTYALPTGYQAEFLGGNANATLQDFSVSDSVTVPSANPSLLVSNTGNDVLNGLTANDTIFASSGNDTLSEGASAVLLAGDGNDSISAYNALGTYLVTVGSGIDTIRIAGSGTVTGGTGTDLIDASASSSLDSAQIALQGTHDTLLGGAGDATVASAGTDGLVLAGTGALSDDDTGHHDTIDAASASSAAVTTGNNAALVVGGSNALSVLDQGFQDTVSAGGGATSVTTGGSQAQVLGGAGALSLLDSGLHDIIQAGSGPTSATLAGSDVIIKASTGSLSVLDQTANNTIIGGSGTSLFAVTIAAAGAAVFGRAGPFDALDSASGALIGTGNGTASVTIAGSNAAVWGGSGTLALSIGGSNAVVGVGTDAATIDASDVGATNATVFGGYSNTPSLDGAFVVTGGANALLVGTGGSNTTVNAGSGSDSVFIGTGSIAGSNLINGGGGPLLVDFVGGAGSATVFGGSGQTSLFGTAGTDALYQGGSTGAFLYANGTNASGETLSAATSTSNDTLFSGHGNVSMVAGSGNDWLIAGDNTGSLGGAGSVVGGSTMVGGGGQDLFIFASSFSDGADVISNFTASDTVYLSGYDTLAGGAADSDTQAMHALQDATVSGGNTTIALADGTSITFVDTTTAQLQGHLFST